MQKDLILAQGYLQAGLLEAAAAGAAEVLDAWPNDPDACYIYGSVLERQNMPEKALPFMRKAAEGNPRDPVVRHALGLILYHMDQLGEALENLRFAKDLGGDVMCDETLAACLVSLSCPDQAEPFLRSVTESRPDDPIVWANLASALIDLNRCDEAIAACDRALVLDPCHADAHMARAIANLLAGRWGEAWPEYEWRWQTKAFQDIYPSPSCPRWDGNVLPAGYRLWVRGEQGYGDQIQFARYLPLAAERSGGPVVVSANGSLHSLLLSMPCVERCVEICDVPEGCVAEVPMQTLAEVFASRPDHVPAEIPYFTVTAENENVQLHRSVRRRLRVGVCWAGKPKPRNRAIDPVLLQKVFEQLDAEIFSFQFATDAFSMPSDANWVDLAPKIQNFSDTAAFLSQMDVVVSVDTGIAHLAGALGLPTCLLLIHGADWRWLRDVNWTAWYPSTILLRQHERGDWNSPLYALEAILKQTQDSLSE